jgi:hypothetical protein
MLLVSKFIRGTASREFSYWICQCGRRKGGRLFTAGDPEYPIFIGATAEPFRRYVCWNRCHGNVRVQ